MGITLPRRSRGRPSADANGRYGEQVKAFCEEIEKISSTLDFRVSSRGWCYILEEHGLLKDDFDAAQRLITDCRKSGDLPLNICAEDEARAADLLEEIDDETPEEFAHTWFDHLERAHLQYTPKSFWADCDVYVELLVEKIDLKGLFSPVCKNFHVPLINGRGWSDLNSRAAMMDRFAEQEAEGKECILLYCGDHDPAGLRISDFLRSNFEDLSKAVGWDPEGLIIDRFGLDADFIEREHLTWIDNLITSSGGDLANPDHADFDKSYVQDYLKRFGARKVEANALVVRPKAGRQLCRKAILKYVSTEAVADYESYLREVRAQARDEMRRLLQGGATS